LAEEEHITVGDLSRLLELFRGRVYRASIEKAIEEIEGWQCKLEAAGGPDLASIAENLGQLRTLLAADHLDADAVGWLLSELGEQTVRVGGSGVPEAVDERLQRLGGLLDADGRMLRMLVGQKGRPSGGERVSPDRGSQ
jgi:hypothetical protein